MARNFLFTSGDLGDEDALSLTVEVVAASAAEAREKIERWRAEEGTDSSHNGCIVLQAHRHQILVMLRVPAAANMMLEPDDYEVQ